MYTVTIDEYRHDGEVFSSHRNYYDLNDALLVARIECSNLVDGGWLYAEDSNSTRAIFDLAGTSIKVSVQGDTGDYELEEFDLR